MACIEAVFREKKSLQEYLEVWNPILNFENQTAAVFLSFIYVRAHSCIWHCVRLCEKDIKGAGVRKVQLQGKNHQVNCCSESCLGFPGLVFIFTLEVVNGVH